MSARPVPVGDFRGLSREGSVNGAYLDTLGPMDVVDLPNTEPMRCPREDVATDSVAGVWFSLYWGLCGHHVHALTPPGGATGGPEGQKMKVGKSAQTCLILYIGVLGMLMHQY